MKKQLVLSLVLFSSLSSMLMGQIGIGTENFSVSEVLNIESSNKGVLFPRLMIPDPSNSIVPAENPKQYMIAFNDDPNYTNENSFHYTYRKPDNTMAWRGVLDINIINARLVPIRTNTCKATDGGSQDVGTGKPVPYIIGEGPEAHKWVEIPGLSKIVNIKSNKNEGTIVVDGMIQDNNTGSEKSSNSYAIGLFLDDKLFTVRTYVVNSSNNSPCAYQAFNLKSNVYNLTKGKHKFSIYAITRSLLSGDATTLTFGAANSGCKSGTYLSGLMSRGQMAVQIQESRQK